jgi:transcriptional regulator with XRE-family HTH domain
MLMSKAELARQLGVSRTYITLLAQGKRKPSKCIFDRLAALGLTAKLDANQGMHEHTTFNCVLITLKYFSRGVYKNTHSVI